MLKTAIKTIFTLTILTFVLFTIFTVKVNKTVNKHIKEPVINVIHEDKHINNNIDVWDTYFM